MNFKKTKIKKAFIKLGNFLVVNFFVEWPNSLSYLTLKKFKNYYHSYFEKKVNSVLDVGAGNSPFSIYFKNVEKLDFSKISKDYQFESSLDYDQDICGDISNIEKKYDLILCIDVLEHLESPNRALDNMFTLLNENGYLLISIPFMDGLHMQPRDYFRLTPYFFKLWGKHNKLSIVKIDIRGDLIHTIYIFIIYLIQAFLKFILIPLFLLNHKIYLLINSLFWLIQNILMFPIVFVYDYLLSIVIKLINLTPRKIRIFFFKNYLFRFATGYFILFKK